MGLVGAFHAFLVEPERRTYRCTECDNEVTVDRDQRPPRCLICKGDKWEPLEASHNPSVARRP